MKNAETINRIVAFSIAVAAVLPLPAVSQAPTPISPTPNARQVEWFHRERMAFFHFGMNTFTNVEWGTGNESPSLFNPTALDCNQWIRTIKNAGFTAAILVAKHHDGFCLWPSVYTTHDVASSPWKSGNGDVVKEFTDACQAAGIKAGIYLSCGDFHHDITGVDYPAFYMNQTLEMVKNYGTIWEMWWDGANNKLTRASFKVLADTIHVFQPTAAIFGHMAFPACDLRWVGNEAGNAGDPCWSSIDSTPLITEQTSILNSGQVNGSFFVPAESDVSIRPGWFWHASQDAQVKSVNTLLGIYYTTTGRNTVWLLNVPPDNRGLVKPTDSMRIDSLGCWLYGTFLTNLAVGATVMSLHPRGTGYEPANLVDGLESTYYATPDVNRTDTVTFNLGSSKTFDVIMVQEVIQLGHRTTGWAVQSSTNGTTWTAITGATGKQCIGYKWLVRVTNPVTASYVRLCITAGRACPAVHTFGLFRQAFVRPPIVAVAPAPPPAAEGFPLRMLPGRSIAVPAVFNGKPVTVDFYDLRGRCAKRVTVPAGGSVPFAERGLFLVKCNTGVLKYMNLR